MFTLYREGGEGGDGDVALTLRIESVKGTMQWFLNEKSNCDDSNDVHVLL